MYPWGTDPLDRPDLGSKSYLTGEIARKSQAGFHVGEHLTGKSRVRRGMLRDGKAPSPALCVPQSWDWGVGVGLLSF